MRVLLDEQLPRQLAFHIPEHHVRTVQQEGWAGLKNGELLQRAVAAEFDVFVTADQNLRFQQNLAGVALCVDVITAVSNALEDLLPAIPAVVSAIEHGRRGEVQGDWPRHERAAPV